MVMSPIKVIIKTVEVPEKMSIPEDSIGDTMFFIHLMKQQRELEERKRKVSIYLQGSVLIYILMGSPHPPPL